MTITVWLYFAGMVLGLAGLALLVASLIPAWRRQKPVWTRFWAPREMFEGRELIYNRLGFGLAIAGIALGLASLFRLVWP